ncbi:MAG: hypothetical protein JWN99_1740, partial [Ilumatobacteraceae bacterium]|nr:hypothetical protein [Ilumatobacteraceae bacterium]
RVLMGRTARRTNALALRLAVEAQLTDEPVFAPPTVAASHVPAAHAADVTEAMESLRDALRKMEAASGEVHLERRQEARTLVNDVPPSL